MGKRYKDLPICYIIVRNDTWLMADGIWTHYGPELAGYTTNHNLAKQFANQLGGIVQSLSYTEVMALSLEIFDFNDNSSEH